MPGDNDVSIIDGVKFECKCCGTCCLRYPYYAVSLIDIQNISSWLGMSPADFFDRYCDVVETAGSFRYSVILADDGCPFLKENLCSIHFVKPIGCWVFPESSLLSLTKLKVSVSGIKSCGLADLPDGDQMLRTDMELLAARDVHFEATKEYFKDHDAFEERSWREATEKLRNKLADAREIEKRAELIRKKAALAIDGSKPKKE
ncbi:zinc/iron-chelating domain-containing protein [Methanocella sp. CWC-04]|uniref:Zinc/iron-chelating domain-containing protein n=1 Tax=Methanooceanicella nereidis TaxID=2052831 RepID=A0AAP2RG97_9EURY|nr:YkgJ family cysteine cluster protein [Methanocella sp. CWC-04]MCD1295585.1 zinc/iron-chelating domain-containing protein [Methanocella sp. CWC-04]